MWEDEENYYDPSDEDDFGPSREDYDAMYLWDEGDLHDNY